MPLRWDRGEPTHTTLTDTQFKLVNNCTFPTYLLSSSNLLTQGEMSVDREIQVVIYTIHFADVIHPGVFYFTMLRDFLHVLRTTEKHQARVVLTAHAPNTSESHNIKADIDRQFNDRRTAGLVSSRHTAHNTNIITQSARY